MRNEKKWLKKGKREEQKGETRRIERGKASGEVRAKIKGMGE